MRSADGDSAVFGGALHTREVGGSKPPAPITETAWKWTVSAFRGALDAPSDRPEAARLSIVCPMRATGPPNGGTLPHFPLVYVYGSITHSESQLASCVRSCRARRTEASISTRLIDTLSTLIPNGTPRVRQ
jgi:hypothetical protein